MIDSDILKAQLATKNKDFEKAKKILDKFLSKYLKELTLQRIQDIRDMLEEDWCGYYYSSPIVQPIDVNYSIYIYMGDVLYTTYLDSNSLNIDDILCKLKKDYTRYSYKEQEKNKDGITFATALDALTYYSDNLKAYAS